MLRILIICTGNTCRSPMAEVLLRRKIEQAGLNEKIMVSSAGIATGGKFPASAGALAIMRSWGLNLTNHISRQLVPEYTEAADLVLTMTAGHKQTVLKIAPAAAGKVYSLKEYAGADCDVADPFGGSNQDYQACAEQIEKMLAKIWEKIVTLAGKNF